MLLAAFIASTVTLAASTQESSLVNRYIEQEGICRGSTDAAKSEKAYAARDKLGDELAEAGFCFGHKSDQSMAEMSWHKCEAGSNLPTVEGVFRLATRPGKAEYKFDGIRAKLDLELEPDYGQEKRMVYNTYATLNFICRKNKTPTFGIAVTNVDPLDASAAQDKFYELSKLSFGGETSTTTAAARIKERDFMIAIPVRDVMPKLLEAVYDRKSLSVDLSASNDPEFRAFEIDLSFDEKDRDQIGSMFQICETLALSRKLSEDN